MPTRIEISEDALKEQEAILGYWLEEDNARLAERIKAAFDNKLNLLETHPELGSSCGPKNLFRRTTVKPHRSSHQYSLIYRYDAGRK